MRAAETVRRQNVWTVQRQDPFAEQYGPGCSATGPRLSYRQRRFEVGWRQTGAMEGAARISPRALG